MATTIPRRRKSQQRLFLDAVSWRAYERLGRVFQDRPLRITYDRGRLEIMTLSTKHEFWKHAIRRLIETLVEETDNQIAGYGSMTFKRQLKKRGLEPDECFWIQNESAVRGRSDFQIDEVPPPDLVLEIEVSRSVIDRIGIYAAFGVPEIWRCDGEKLTVCRLVDGEYQESSTSVAFPFLRPRLLLEFLTRHLSLGEVAIVREFRKWVREQIALGWPQN